LPVEIRGQKDFNTMPWRNGLGQTTELARADGVDGFFWRISRAAVAQDGPFSNFPNIDRVLFLLSGDGLIFDFGGGNICRLESRFAHHAFPGDIPVHCRLVGGACEDLNIMTDRRWGVARVALHPGDVKAECSATSVFCVLDGEWRAGGRDVEPGSIVIVRAEHVALEGAGVLLQVDFLPN